MKKLTTVSISFLVTLCSWAQTKLQSEQRIQHVFHSNLPDNLRDFCDQEKFRLTYKINRNLNPFYLRGDFDGDKKIDYALAIVELKSNKKGILIYHPATKKYFLAGSGKSIQGGGGDDYSWMDAWSVTEEKNARQGASNFGPPKLIGEAILVQKLESASGLIYWTGTEYKWYQQGD